MKKALFFIILIFLFSGFVIADLGDFPDNFISEDELNGYVVVGKDGTATDVLSQSVISMKLNSYIGSPQKGINKLDSDVDIENNLILIGNPCINKLTAELLGNPEPCDRDFPADKAYIKYYEEEGYKYVVVAGKDDKATKKAAEYLADFDKNVLIGEEAIIEFETAEGKDFGLPPEDIVAPRPAAEEDEKESEDRVDEIKEISKEDTEEGDEEEDWVDGEVEKEEEEEGAGVIIVEDKNIFARMWDWLTGLFGK